VIPEKKQRQNTETTHNNPIIYKIYSAEFSSRVHFKRTNFTYFPVYTKTVTPGKKYAKTKKTKTRHLSPNIKGPDLDP